MVELKFADTLVPVDPQGRFPMKCTICSARANRTHYSVVACNAQVSCGSFFRRTILLRRNYLCAKKNCHLTGVGPPCKACRLQKCVASGMAIDSIMIRKMISAEDQFADCSAMERSGKALEATFVNKINILSKMAQRQNRKLEMGILRPSLDRMQMSKAAEFETLIIYLRDSGLKELGMREIDLAAIANRSYYNWLFFSGLSATLRNGGHFARVVHISDCGYLPLSFSECHKYLEQHGVKNAEIAAKHYFSMLERSLEIAQSFHNSHLDKVEFSTLCHLSVLRKAKELFPTMGELDEYTNEILRQIKQYHDENYRDVAVRFGDLILLLSEINQIEQEMHEFAQLLTLCGGWERMLPKLTHDYGLSC